MKTRTILLGFLALLLVGATAQGQEFTSEICVPQFADGMQGPLRWQTSVVLMSQSMEAAQVQMSFFRVNGDPLMTSMRTRLGKGPAFAPGPNGMINLPDLAPGSGRTFRTEGTGPLQTGYLLIRSQDRIQAHTILQLFDQQGTLISETGVIPHPQFRAGGFLADQTEGQGVGLALTNPAGVTAECQIEVFAEDETTSLGTFPMTLGPRSQTAQFLAEAVPEILTGEVGFVRITCDNPICALALNLRGLRVLQVPIFIDTE